MMQILYAVAVLTFIAEVYNALGHSVVLVGWRLLPRRDYYQIRHYFLADAFCVAVAAVLTGSHYSLAFLQVVQHLYAFATLGQDSTATKILEWSSLEWFQSSRERLSQLISSRVSPLDCFLHTLFDIAVHICMAHALAVQYMDATSVLLCYVVAQSALCLIVFNPKFAWSRPGNIPAWVRRRLTATCSTHVSE